jgi:hypothetical protein
MIELAWGHLLHQPDSALAEWYRRRTVHARSGTRKNHDRCTGPQAPYCALAWSPLARRRQVCSFARLSDRLFDGKRNWAPAGRLPVDSELQMTDRGGGNPM